MWRYWLVARGYEASPQIRWPLLALVGLSLILLGVLMVIEPALLALLVAALLVASGLNILGFALGSAWHAWRARPRRIRIRVAR